MDNRKLVIDINYRSWAYAPVAAGEMMMPGMDVNKFEGGCTCVARTSCPRIIVRLVVPTKDECVGC